MASIRSINGKLFLDFRFKGKRCREYTSYGDNPENRRRMEETLRQIEAEIEKGTFSYRQRFPESKLAAKFDSPETVAMAKSPVAEAIAAPQDTLARNSTPLFSSFADQWFGQQSVEWRRTYKATNRQILDLHLIPAFGLKRVGEITKDDILNFRSVLAKVPGRKKNATLSSRRINAVMLVLRQIIDEAADRFKFTTPWTRIKPLRNKKSDVEPFSLEEVQRVLATIRPDFRNYMIVRFFTGMRTGEINGLKWKYVEFDKRLILIREALVDGEEEYTKTDSSQREIQMSEMVFSALKEQQKGTGHLSAFAFCNRDGKPLDSNNFTKRVWYPLLRYLGLSPRRPYQTRHTAATLWLASGENPQWIARQLGHSSTEMLFKVYSRFVPNLTRRDGSAFERLVSGTFGTGQQQTHINPITQPDAEEYHV